MGSSQPSGRRLETFPSCVYLGFFFQDTSFGRLLGIIVEKTLRHGCLVIAPVPRIHALRSPFLVQALAGSMRRRRSVPSSQRNGVRWPSLPWLLPCALSPAADESRFCTMMSGNKHAGSHQCMSRAAPESELARRIF
jgi:hypothetical protein